MTASLIVVSSQSKDDFIRFREMMISPDLGRHGSNGRGGSGEFVVGMRGQRMLVGEVSRGGSELAPPAEEPQAAPGD